MKKRINGAWVTKAPPEYGTKADTITSLPADIIADGNNATATIYGDLVESSQPSAVVVNIYPPIDDNSINRGYWGRWYDYEQYLPDEPCYNTSSKNKELCNEIYVTAGTYTFSVYMKTEVSNTVRLYAHGLADFPNYAQKATVTETSGVQYNLTTAYQRCTFTFTATTDGYVYPRVVKTDDTGSNVIVTCFQLESGSTATPYLAYGKTVISPIYPSETGDRASNLFDKDNATVKTLYIDSSLGTFRTSSNARTVIMSCEPNTTYTISKMLSARFSVAYSAQIPVSGDAANGAIDNHTGTDITITTDNNAQYLSMFIYNSVYDTATFEDIENSIMVNEGPIPHGFVLPVQCGGVTTNVYTTEPLRKIGEYVDYKSESAEYRAIKQLVLTGQEAVTYDSTNSRFSTLLRGMDYKGARATTFVCSHYEVIDDGRPITQVPNNTAYAGGTVANPLIYIKTTDYTSDTDFKAYLAQQYAAGTPVTVWYVLATPTTESIEAPAIPTTAGSQTFDVNTELKPSKVELTYKGWHKHTPKEYSGGSWN